MVASTKNIVINEKKETIPVHLNIENDTFIVDIDGVEWVRTDNNVHATILYNMIADHITEYMHYEKK